MLAKYSIFAIGCLTVSACGVRVPDIQEPYNTPGDALLLVQSITQSVRCELIDSIKDIRSNDLALSNRLHLKPHTDFLQDWGAQMTLTLTVDEKSSVGPNVVWTPPNPMTSIFSLSGGANVAADATRTDKLSFYYRVSDLLKYDYCTRGVQQGSEVSPLVTSDLKLEEWLAAYISPLGTNVGQAPTSAQGILKSSVLSHDIKFDLTYSGNITPAWKLTRVSVNQSGQLLSASRDRTQDLIVTLGPGDKTGLTTSAGQNADVSQQIGNAVGANIKNALTQ